MAILHKWAPTFARKGLTLEALGPLFLLHASVLLALLPTSSQKLLLPLPGGASLSNSSSSSPPLEILRHHRSITHPNASTWEWTHLSRRHLRLPTFHSGFGRGGGERRWWLPNGGRRSQCLYNRFHRNTVSQKGLHVFHNNNNTSSSASTASSSNNNNNIIQLSKIQRVSNWIHRLCSLQDPVDRLERLLSKSPCSEYKLDICQALKPTEIAHIIGSDVFVCFKTVENVWKTFHHIKNTLDDFNLLLPSFDTSPYSVEFELEQCKIAYGFWICSESLPLYLTSTMNNKTMPVAPCRSVCRDVEKRCPFLIRGTEDDKAAGNPTFLCRDENVPSVILEDSSPPTKCCYEQIKDPPPGSWRSITKSSFLDPMASCLSLLEPGQRHDLEGKSTEEEEERKADDDDPGGTWDVRDFLPRSGFRWSSTTAAAEELTACDSFYFVPSNLNVSTSMEKMDWERWMESWEEEGLQRGEDPVFPLQVLHYQFNLEEVFLTLYNFTSTLSSSSGGEGSASILPFTWVLHPLMYHLLIRTYWNYLTS